MTATTARPEQPETLALVDAFARAFKRAVEANLLDASYLDHGDAIVPSASHPGDVHICTKTGPAWHAWSCDCTGANHAACMHRAVAVYGGLTERDAAPATPAAPAMPRPFQCIDCGQLRVTDAGLYCARCAADRGLRARQCAPTPFGGVSHYLEAGSVVVGCITCGLTYAYSEESSEARLYCPGCRPSQLAANAAIAESVMADLRAGRIA